MASQGASKLLGNATCRPYCDEVYKCVWPRKPPHPSLCRWLSGEKNTMAFAKPCSRPISIWRGKAYCHPWLLRRVIHGCHPPLSCVCGGLGQLQGHVCGGYSWGERPTSMQLPGFESFWEPSQLCPVLLQLPARVTLVHAWEDKLCVWKPDGQWLDKLRQRPLLRIVLLTNLRDIRGPLWLDRLCSDGIRSQSL